MCCWHVCLVVCFVFFCSLLFVCKTLAFDPGVRGKEVGPPVHPLSCVLLVLRLALSVLFVVVTLRRVVLSFGVFARVARLSSLLVVCWVCVGGFLCFMSLLCFKRVCQHRRPLQRTALRAFSSCPQVVSVCCPLLLFLCLLVHIAHGGPTRT